MKGESGVHRTHHRPCTLPPPSLSDILVQPDDSIEVQMVGGFIQHQ